MSAVLPADNTLAYIRQKVRRLTVSSSESALSTADIDQYINRFYSTDFPYGIKISQMKSVYTFFTEPYRDRYPLDVNYNQGVTAPVYIEGILGSLFKDRQQFYNIWPKWPTKYNPISGDGVTTSFTFNIPGPFLSQEVVIGGIDINGNPITVNDDGSGNLLFQVPNPVLTIPPYNTNGIAPIPGMHNQNTGNPGLNYQGEQTSTFINSIGTVNYVNGNFVIDFPVAPASGTEITLWVSQYQTGRPFNVLFWNNEFVVRPIPKIIHKITVETYLTPVQFMASTDVPILNQWAQYIAYGAALEILRDRQDFDGVDSLMEGFKRQEGLVLERQSTEEIGQPNIQMYNTTIPYSVYGGWGGWGAGNG